MEHEKFGSVTDITRHLKGVKFPAKKQDLIQHVRQQGVDQDVILRLEKLQDKEFRSADDVMKEFGKAA